MSEYEGKPTNDAWAGGLVWRALPLGLASPRAASSLQLRDPSGSTLAASPSEPTQWDGHGGWSDHRTRLCEGGGGGPRRAPDGVGMREGDIIGSRAATR